MEKNSAGLDTKPVQLSVGSKFDDFEEWSRFFKSYQKENKEVFTVKNSKTIINSHLAGTVDEKFKYVTVEYGCKFGGSKVRTVASQRKTSTYKLGCPASIKIKLSADKQSLEVIELDLVHKYHSESKVFYSTLPEVRRLSPSAKAEMLKALQVDSNKKLIQNDLAAENNKFVTLKDLSNLKTRAKSTNDNSLEKAVALLKDKFGCDVSIFHEENIFKGLYFSTSDMRATMLSWPEIVLVDGTYKLLDTNLTVMILLIHDANGRGEVVGVGLLSSEDAATLKWFAETFKKQNFEACQKRQCMMTDKDMTERNALKDIFPGIPIYLCLFHTLKTFARTVTTDKMKITRAERDKCLQLLEKMAYSSSEESYEKLYDELTHEAPASVRDYFDTNWHPLKTEWTLNNMTRGNLNIHTNNQLESINGKIKQVVRRNSSLCDFVERFFQWLRSHNHETDVKVAKQFLKKPTGIENYTNCEFEYSQYLSDYAYRKVLEEIKGHETITFRQVNGETRECAINFKGTIVNVTPSKCECPFHKSSLLPCKHILAVRRQFEMSPFDKDLCDKRWTKDFVKEHQRSFRKFSIAPSEDQVETSSRVTTIAAPRKVVQSVGQKRKLLNTVATDIVHLGSLSCGARFDDKVAVLQDIATAWRQGFNVRVVRTDCGTDENQDFGQNVVSHLDSSLTSLTLEDCNGSGNAKSKMSKKIDPVPSIEKTRANSTMEVAEIEMPSAIRVVGRPRGFLSTTVGNIKRGRSSKSFTELSAEDKVRTILGWCICDDILTAVLNHEFVVDNKTISNINADNLHDAFASDAVDIEVIKDYFETLAFKRLQRIVALKRRQDLRKCTICKNTMENRRIECKSCLLWYDFKCINMKRAPTSRKPWFCPKCTRQ